MTPEKNIRMYELVEEGANILSSAGEYMSERKIEPDVAKGCVEVFKNVIVSGMSILDSMGALGPLTDDISLVFDEKNNNAFSSTYIQEGVGVTDEDVKELKSRYNSGIINIGAGFYTNPGDKPKIIDPVLGPTNLGYVGLTPAESIMFALAHEVRHAYQFKTGHAFTVGLAFERRFDWDYTWFSEYNTFSDEFIARVKMMDPDSLNRIYRNFPWEKDANEFAAGVVRAIRDKSWKFPIEDFPIVKDRGDFTFAPDDYKPGGAESTEAFAKHVPKMFESIFGSDLANKLSTEINDIVSLVAKDSDITHNFFGNEKFVPIPGVKVRYIDGCLANTGDIKI